MSKLLKIKTFASNKIQGLKKWFRLHLLPYTAKCGVRGQQVLLRIDSPKEFKRAVNYSKKEPNTLDWLDGLKEGEVLYDIGANIGQYSLYPAVKLAGKCQVYAFEPEALNFAKLNTNIHINSLSNSIKAYPIALSGENKISEFHVNKMGYGEALHRLDDNIDNMNQVFVPSHIQGTISLTLDTVVYDYGMACPNYLKIDVDGLEREIVLGGKKVFFRPEVKSILVEVSRVPNDNSEREWFIQFFGDLGFKLADYTDRRKQTENLIFQRFLK